MTRTNRYIAILGFLLLAFARAGFGWSLEEEMKIGREEHQKIIGHYGVYQDRELQAYVDRVGQRVAAQSSREEIEYQFTVLNDDMVNAMALPGGFIYITRGMLMHMNSESELAAVLGHEIAHVTEKHAIRAKRRGTGLAVMNTVLAIATGQPSVYELGSIFSDVLLKGHSREFELEADEVGARYMAQAGYSPLAMLDTIEALKNRDRTEILQARKEKREPRVYHGFLSSHPDNDTRYKEAVRASEKARQEQEEFVGTDEFLQKLNGLAYGKVNQPGVVRKNTFYYPEYGVKLSFPDNWRRQSQRLGLLVVSQADEASFRLMSVKFLRGVTPEFLAREQLGFSVREGREITIAGLPAYLGIADRLDSPYGPRPTRFAVIQDSRKGVAYVLTGAGKNDLRKIRDDGNYIASIFSFDRMTRDDFREARQPTIQVVRVESGTTMEVLAAESVITNYALDKLRVMNGLYPDKQPAEGQLIKIVN